ncbi:restriction endonuclease subunit R [Candidatus Poribacteria bacterium]|nr:restriction endonuclease subunit R [Candidatus Poribacteria bacterium]MYA56492.1 restriction endonuclease subunit R [Candidatus Poribacteria bacterium]
MMELKVYQQNALDAFSHWLEALEETQNTSKTAIEALKQAGVDSIPAELQNYPQNAWQNLKQNDSVAPTAGEYVTRTDDAKRPIPHVCFKVPTGGGKTLLAAAALERLHRQRGLTLWIVPTKAIYAQTKTALWNKEHPYRKMLERASAGSVKMLEKDDPFNRDDIANYLCVMLLMLPAANRQKGREFLRMFKDTGKYPSFFPDSDDIFGDARMRNEYPDLECKSEREGGVVKQSLFNVFKMLRPVIVLDEAHKAYGASRQKANEEFARSINRLDPRMIIELSATPNRGISNLLVDIDGTALKKEEMIKLPVQVKSNSRKNAETTSWRDDWQYTLQQAVDELQRLNDAAEALENTTNRYIRPIAVVRVERTGKDQRDGERIHAEDVREYLTRLGVSPEAIRVKSSENDELQNEDLLSEMSQVRWIITKSALMEGWDCPFAYLLVMLDNTQAQKAITQLVGRVMRQPHAQLTGQKALDQCYVYCNNTDVGIAVEQVKNGLESEGLTGLGDEVVGAAGIQEIEDFRTQIVKRRAQFQDQAIYLPVVLHRDGDAWIQLNYQSHILPHIKWSAIQAPTPNASASDSMIWQSATVDVGEAPPVYHPDQEPYVDKTVDISDFARRLSDLLPNPWRAACIASQMRESLRQSGKTEEDIYDRRSYLVHALREHVKHEIEQQAEWVFRRKLDHGEIRFDLETEEPNYKLRYQYEIEVRANDRPLTRYGSPVQLSLFEPIFEQHFDSEFEKKFAYYLDERRALQWWHRIAVRQRGEYYVQGWKQGRIYPDFVAMTREIAGVTRVLIFETKGEHLGGNLDTEYKKKVLKTLEDTFNNGGTMMVREGTTRAGIFQLVFSEQEFPEITARLGEHNLTEADN